VLVIAKDLHLAFPPGPMALYHHRPVATAFHRLSWTWTSPLLRLQEEAGAVTVVVADIKAGTGPRALQQVTMTSRLHAVQNRWPA
jgi:hypothetical protein